MGLRNQIFYNFAALSEIATAGCYLPCRHSPNGLVFSRAIGYETMTAKPMEFHFDVLSGVRKVIDSADFADLQDQVQAAVLTRQPLMYVFYNLQIQYDVLQIYKQNH